MVNGLILTGGIKKSIIMITVLIVFLSLSGCTNEKAIVGKWTCTNGAGVLALGNTLTVNSDHTYVKHNPGLGDTSGKWSSTLDGKYNFIILEGTPYSDPVNIEATIKDGKLYTNTMVIAIYRKQ